MFWCKNQKDDIKSEKKKQKASKHYPTRDNQTDCSDKNSIRSQFRREIEENNNRIRMLSDSMKCIYNLQEIERLPYPKFYFSSIKKYFDSSLSEWEKDQNSNIILQSTISVYQQLARRKKMERELTISINFYLEIIKRILRNQHHDQETLAALSQNSENLKCRSPHLLRQFEDVMMLSKKAMKNEDGSTQRSIMNQIRELRNHMVKKEDMMHEFAIIRQGIERNHGSNNSPGRQCRNCGDRQDHNHANGQLPPKYTDEELDKAYKRQLESYNQSKRYWVNEAAEKNIEIAELETKIRRLSEKLAKNQKYSQTQFLRNQVQEMQACLREKEKKEHLLMDRLHQVTFKLRLCEQINEYYKDHQEDHRMKLAQMSRKIVNARETNRRNTQLNMQVGRLTQTIIGLERVLQQKQANGQKPSENNHQLLLQLSAERQKNQRLEHQLAVMTEKLNALKNYVGDQKKTIFVGSILENRRLQKKYLYQSIQAEKKTKIYQTKLVYDLVRDGEVNLLTRLNGVSSVVLLIRTNNALIAGYYSGSYQRHGPVHEEALLISLDHYKSYPLRNRMGRGMFYDKDYLIFGNEEIKVKAGHKRVKSNFGLMNGFFDSKGDTVNALLRAGNSNQVDAINYQIYEVIFEERYRPNDWV